MTYHKFQSVTWYNYVYEGRIEFLEYLMFPTSMADCEIRIWPAVGSPYVVRMLSESLWPANGRYLLTEIAFVREREHTDDY